MHLHSIQNRVAFEQKVQLVEAMDTKFILLYGKHGTLDASQARREEWAKLTRVLNTMGPPKTEAAWKECFSNMRLKVKKKVAEI